MTLVAAQKNKDKGPAKEFCHWINFNGKLIFALDKNEYISESDILHLYKIQKKFLKNGGKNCSE